MANHGKKRTPKQVARHYSKPSRLARHARRWDERVRLMTADLNLRAAEAAARTEVEAALVAQRERNDEMAAGQV